MNVPQSKFHFLWGDTKQEIERKNYKKAPMDSFHLSLAYSKRFYIENRKIR